jgi:hypothetical protein
MKLLLFAGLLLVVPGIASLVVPIPQTETEGIPVGNTTFGVQTSLTGNGFRHSSVSC